MKSYLITDPLQYSSKPQVFCKNFTLNATKKKPYFALLRDKTTQSYKDLATAFVPLAKSLKIKPIVHTDHHLAYALKAFGVHLPFTQKYRIEEAKRLRLYVIVSTHAIQEAQEAEFLGADAITFSPIFDTPNKGKPVGLVKLKEIIDKISIDCYALGGIITQEHITKCSNVGAKGFASIRYFLI